MSCCGGQSESSLINETVSELIALGAAMAANSEEAFQLHHARLHKMGVSKEDMVAAVNIALRVKMAPHRNLVEMAEHYLVGGAEPEETEGGCCGGDCNCGDDCDCDGNCESEGCGEGCGCK